MAQKTRKERGNRADAGEQAIAEALARRLKTWRLSADLPLKHLAIDLGVSVSTVSQWENTRRFPSVSNLVRIASYMGTCVCCLLHEGTGDCPHPPRAHSDA